MNTSAKGSGEDVDRYYWIEVRAMNGAPILRVRLHRNNADIYIRALQEEMGRQLREGPD